jgi:hypothetical protein
MYVFMYVCKYVCMLILIKNQTADNEKMEMNLAPFNAYLCCHHSIEWLIIFAVNATTAHL